MNVQAILQKIEDDAGKSATRIREEAEQKASDLRDESHKRLRLMHDDVVKQAEAESVALAERMGRMGELDMRKELLAAKRVVMDEAFERALQALRAAPADNVRKLMLTKLCEAARGNETLIICDMGKSWFDDSFLSELNAELQKAGKPAELKLGDERRGGLTGAILSHGGTEVYCTLEGMLAEARPAMETDIARLLFDD